MLEKGLWFAAGTVIGAWCYKTLAVRKAGNAADELLTKVGVNTSSGAGAELSGRIRGLLDKEVSWTDID